MADQLPLVVLGTAPNWTSLSQLKTGDRLAGIVNHVDFGADAVMASSSSGVVGPQSMPSGTVLANLGSGITGVTLEALSVALGASTSLGELADVNTMGATTGDTLIYNGTTSQFETAPIDLSSFSSDSTSGYEFTGAFEDRLSGQAGQEDFGTFVGYTQAMVDDDQWLRFGFSQAAQTANDNAYWNDPDPNLDPTFDQTKGLFGGMHMPPGVDNLFDFDYSDPSYSSEVTGQSLNYTAADGSIDFTGCKVGDLALVRFDFNVIPQVSNTTIEIALIWQTRDANGPTFTFPLTGTPIFYGTGTVGKTFLNRPILSAYFASNEDVNARALLAIKADNPVQVAPLTTLVIINR